MYSTCGKSLATCCTHQSLQGNTYCCTHQKPHESYWDSAMGGGEPGPALVLCSHKHHNELLEIQFVDPVWLAKAASGQGLHPSNANIYPL